MKELVYCYNEIWLYIKGCRLWALLTLLMAAELLVFCLLNSAPSTQCGQYVAERQSLYANLFSFILFENLQACLSILASGIIPLGFGALFTCYGMMDGLVSTGKWLLPNAGGWKMALCLIPHGVFEIPAMIISVLAAVLLSRAVTVAIWRLIIRTPLKVELLYELKLLLKITMLVLLPLILLGAIMEVSVSCSVADLLG